MTIPREREVTHGVSELGFSDDDVISGRRPDDRRALPLPHTSHLT
jgi:hypothetical protein